MTNPHRFRSRSLFALSIVAVLRDGHVRFRDGRYYAPDCAACRVHMCERVAR